MLDCRRYRIQVLIWSLMQLERGIAVVPIPGANAALSALIVSGLADGTIFVCRISAA